MNGLMKHYRDAHLKFAEAIKKAPVPYDSRVGEFTGLTHDEWLRSWEDHLKAISEAHLELAKDLSVEYVSDT